MKKSKKLVMLFAIILVVALCVSLLAACSGKKKIDQDTVTGYLSEGIEKLMPENGYYFGIDTAINLAYTEGGKTRNFTFAIKGTIDTQPGTSTTDSQFMVELKEGAKTIVGVYYKDSPDGGIAVGEYAQYAPKMYLNINDEYKFAYNTYSIKKLVNDLSPKSETSDVINIGGTEIDLLPAIISALAGPEAIYTQKTVKKEIHVSFDINPKNIMTLLGGLIDGQSDVINAITENLGMGELNAEALLNLDLDMPTTVLLRFEKVGKAPGKLLGAKLELKTGKEREIKVSLFDKVIIDTSIPNVELSIDVATLNLQSGTKVEISTPSTDANYKLINLINIDFGGKITITDSATKVAKKYDLIIKANANPIPVAYLGDTSWDVKEAVFKNLGMLHFSIINTANSKDALIDLAYDPAHLGGSNADTAYLTVSLGTIGKISTKVNVSALEGLISGMIEMINGKTDEYGRPIEKPAPETALMADGLAEMDILKELKGGITKLLTGGIKNIVEAIGSAINPAFESPFDISLNGTLLKISNILTKAIDNGHLKLGVNADSNVYFEASLLKLVDAVMADDGLGSILDDNIKSIINSVKGLISKVLGGDVINIEFTGVKYGTVPNDYNAFMYYDANGRGEGTYVKDIVGPQNPQQALKLASGITADEFMDMFNADKNIVMKVTAGINVSNTITKTFRTLYVQGFDPTKTGQQEVIIALKDVNEELASINTIIGIVASGSGIDINKYPLSILKYRVTINVTQVAKV